MERSSKKYLLVFVVSLIALYTTLHLALVPAISVATRYKHGKHLNPLSKWGLAYENHLVVSDWGIELPAWHIPGKSGMPVIIVLTGSGGAKYGTITKWPTLYLHESGYNLFLVDTRGQGHSSGIKTAGIGGAIDIVQSFFLQHLDE